MTSIAPAAVLAAALIGSFASVPHQDPDSEAVLVLAAGEHNIRTVIESAASFLNRNYIYATTDLANLPNSTFQLQNSLKLGRDDCEDVITQIAYTMGLARVPLDRERGIYEWIYMQGPRRGELTSRAVYMTPEEVLQHRRRKVVVLTGLPLQHVDPNQATNQLRPFFIGAGSGSTPLSFGASGSSLLLMGFADQVAFAIDLLTEIDSKAKPSRAMANWQQSVEDRLQKVENALGINDAKN